MLNWKRNIRFSKGDRNALLFITVLLISLYAYNFYYVPEITQSTKTKSLDTILSELDPDSEMTDIDRKKIKRITNSNKERNIKYPPPEYFTFDPNKIDSLQWLKLGVRPWVIKSIMKMKRGGWKYYSCDKLQDIYNLPDSVYQKIRPHCRIEKTPWKNKYNQTSYPKKKYLQHKSSSTSNNSYSPIEYFKFDPNTLDSVGWLRLGVKPWTIKAIMKQRRGGWKYYSCDKLQDIYNLPDSIYQKINPYCHIDSPTTKTTYTGVINLNTASHEELKSLKGIGDVYARIIMEKREKLGGFHSIDQLLEIGLDSQVLTDNKKRLLATGVERPLSLNAPQKALSDHPYISYNLAKLIFRYRQQHGDFQQVHDLNKLRTITDSTFQKLLPYLTI